MKKLLLFTLLSLCISSFSVAQDFSLDELLRLRQDSYPAFESKVHDKGYKLSHLETNERATVFMKGKNVISYYTYYDGNSYRYKHSVSIKFETPNLEEYERLKHQVESTMKYSRTKLRRFANQEYLVHMYHNDELSVRLYDVTYKNDPKPYYEIEIYSIYSDY